MKTRIYSCIIILNLAGNYWCIVQEELTMVWVGTSKKYYVGDSWLNIYEFSHPIKQITKYLHTKNNDLFIFVFLFYFIYDLIYWWKHINYNVMITLQLFKIIELLDILSKKKKFTKACVYSCSKCYQDKQLCRYLRLNPREKNKSNMMKNFLVR